MKNINISINFNVPTFEDVEKVILKVADVTENICASVGSGVTTTAKNVKTKAESSEKLQKTVAKAKSIGKSIGDKVKTTNAEIMKKVSKTYTAESAGEADITVESEATQTPEAPAAEGSEEEGGEGEDSEEAHGRKAALRKCRRNCSLYIKQTKDKINTAIHSETFQTVKTITIKCTITPCDIKKAYLRTLTDIKSILERDPAAESVAEVILLYSGFHAVLSHRIAHFFHNNGLKFTARALSQITKAITGIEIHPGATVGEGLFIDHGTGVVIGETTVIGNNCTIYQGVTLGGTGKQTGKRHPTLGDGVMVGSGAKVLGPVNIGSNSKIAAGAVVLSDIPENSTAVGIPAKVVRSNNQRVSDLDQVHIPDPVSQELCKLNIRLTNAEKQLGISPCDRHACGASCSKFEEALDCSENGETEEKTTK